jgi:hypothetical protein
MQVGKEPTEHTVDLRVLPPVDNHVQVAVAEDFVTGIV